MAYLAPDLVRSVLAGSNFSFLSVDLLMRCELPMDWTAQRRLFAAAAQ